jgi:aminopeptidase N
MVVPTEPVETVEPPAPEPEAVLVQDAHSYARPAEARVTHVALTLDADFAERVLEGTAELTLAAEESATEVVLDTRDLTIQRVTDAAGTPLVHALPC